MDDIKGYVEKFATFGRPVEYKGLKLEPIVVGDSERFSEAGAVLQIEKNKISDVNIIQMSYLEFLVRLMIEDSSVLDDFIEVCNLVFGVQYDESLLDNNKDFNPHDLLMQKLSDDITMLYVNGWDIRFKLGNNIIKFIINGVEIDAKDFDDIRRIIMYQNIYDYDENEMSEDFRRVVEQYYALKNKGIHVPTLEEKIMAVIVTTAYTMEMVEKMPMRSFEALFHASVSKVDYISSKALEPHLKEGHSIDHWVYYPEKNKYDGIFSDANKLAQKITSL